MKINVTNNSSVKLGNIGQVRQAYAGDFSAMPKAIGQLGGAIGDIGRVAGRIAVDLKEREDNARVNEAMSKLIIGSGQISDGILGDDSISPSDYQAKYQDGYDKLYGEVTKDLDAHQLEKMKAASSRVRTSAMISLGHTAMERTVAREKATAAALCAAAKARAVENPDDETIEFCLGAFTDAEKDTVMMIENLEAAGKKDEANTLRESLRIKQRQTIDEILGENVMREIQSLEDEASDYSVRRLKEMAHTKWDKLDEGKGFEAGTKEIYERRNKFDDIVGRDGFGEKTAHELNRQARMALERVQSRRWKAAHERVNQAEIEMFSKTPSADPSGMAAQMTDMANRYKTLSEDKDLPPGERARLAKTYTSLTEQANSLNKRLEEGKAAQAQAQIEHERKFKEAQNQQLFKHMKATFEWGKVIPSGQNLEYDQMAQIALDALERKQITSWQWVDLMNIARTSVPEDMKAFRDAAFGILPFLQRDVEVFEGEFQMKPQSAYKLPLEAEDYDDTYETFINALNGVYERGKANGWTQAEMMAEFKKITQNDRMTLGATRVRERLIDFDYQNYLRDNAYENAIMIQSAFKKQQEKNDKEQSTKNSEK